MSRKRILGSCEITSDEPKEGGKTIDIQAMFDPILSLHGQERADALKALSEETGLPLNSDIAGWHIKDSSDGRLSIRFSAYGLLTLPDDFWGSFEARAGFGDADTRDWLAKGLAHLARRDWTKRLSRAAIVKDFKRGLENRKRQCGAGRKHKPISVPVHLLPMRELRVFRERLQKAGSLPLADLLAVFENQPRRPSRLDWQRHTLIVTLAKHWGKERFPQANGKALAFSHRADGTPFGPFFEAVKLCLWATGRQDSDKAIAKAIEAAR
ncbi:MAG: hypothetical protein J0I86_07490 [Mesorhizobium sp.]|nr:hypothetical protein [Mesorhizobium sp.]